MTPIPSDELRRRLRASVSHRVPPAVRSAHLQGIRAALEAAPSASGPALPWALRMRRGLATALAAATALAPVGVAVAAEGALPGDTLYPAKRAAEAIRRVVDPEVVARHRVAELAALLEAGVDLSALAPLTEEAERAVAALPPDHPLALRLRALLAASAPGEEEPDPLGAVEAEEEASDEAEAIPGEEEDEDEEHPRDDEEADDDEGAGEEQEDDEGDDHQTEEDDDDEEDEDDDEEDDEEEDGDGED